MKEASTNILPNHKDFFDPKIPDFVLAGYAPIRIQVRGIISCTGAAEPSQMHAGLLTSLFRATVDGIMSDYELCKMKHVEMMAPCNRTGTNSVRARSRKDRQHLSRRYLLTARALIPKAEVDTSVTHLS